MNLLFNSQFLNSLIPEFYDFLLGYLRRSVDGGD